jgi:hypothetical protein
LWYQQARLLTFTVMQFLLLAVMIVLCTSLPAASFQPAIMAWLLSGLASSALAAKFSGVVLWHQLSKG